MAVIYKNTALLSRLNAGKLSREEAHAVHMNSNKIMISYLYILLNVYLEVQ